MIVADPTLTYEAELAAATDPANWTVTTNEPVTVSGLLATRLQATSVAATSGYPVGTTRYGYLIDTGDTAVWIETSGTLTDATFATNVSVVDLIAADVHDRGDRLDRMIKAVHTLIYSDDAEATRAFLRDVLQWPSVAEPDAVPSWPIFKTGPSEMGIHPTSGGSGDQAYSIATPPLDLAHVRRHRRDEGRTRGPGCRRSSATSGTWASGSRSNSTCRVPGRSSCTSRVTRRPTTCSRDARLSSAGSYFERGRATRDPAERHRRRDRSPDGTAAPDSADAAR